MLQLRNKLSFIINSHEPRIATRLSQNWVCEYNGSTNSNCWRRCWDRQDIYSYWGSKIATTNKSVCHCAISLVGQHTSLYWLNHFIKLRVGSCSFRTLKESSVIWRSLFPWHALISSARVLKLNKRSVLFRLSMVWYFPRRARRKSKVWSRARIPLDWFYRSWKWWRLKIRVLMGRTNEVGAALVVWTRAFGRFIQWKSDGCTC